MYMHNFLLRMTDNVTSQNIDLSSWDTLCKSIMGYYEDVFLDYTTGMCWEVLYVVSIREQNDDQSSRCTVGMY
jgi:hypothetical protein